MSMRYRRAKAAPYVKIWTGQVFSMIAKRISHTVIMTILVYREAMDIKRQHLGHEAMGQIERR